MPEPLSMMIQYYNTFVAVLLVYSHSANAEESFDHDVEKVKNHLRNDDHVCEFLHTFRTFFINTVYHLSKIFKLILHN